MAKIRRKKPIHENADASITCDFGDVDISRSSSQLTHTHIASSIIVRWKLYTSSLCVSDASWFVVAEEIASQ